MRDAKAGHRMSRNILNGAQGDTANAAAGYNFRRLLAWMAIIWRVLIMAMLTHKTSPNLPSPA